MRLRARVQCEVSIDLSSHGDEIVGRSVRAKTIVDFESESFVQSHRSWIHYRVDRSQRRAGGPSRKKRLTLRKRSQQYLFHLVDFSQSIESDEKSLTKSFRSVCGNDL